ncbi:MULTISPECIES: carbohydrate binding domain-containing protein [unclassified Caulobacter]|uniref:carbohydrate binding domain-containing protein n=1 Tax=unclassified Caulobacter TaxID=2648921 RepID=UPI0004A6C308|nr:carbohydrate binding domain-containing protein [Caulobacter sp. UNC358MFTsu5.1]
MTKIAILAAVAALSLSAAAPPAARAAEPAAQGIMKYAINKPSVAWNVYGPGQTNAPVKDKAVVGGNGVRVQVTSPTPDKPWDSAAGQAVNGKIAKGDIVTIAFWAKAEPVDGGPATANITSVRVQQAAEPWGGIVEGKVAVTSGDWQIYTVSGRASMDADKGGAGVALHLGSAKQTVVLGPLFVLDFGPNYDPSMAAK